MKRNKPKYGQIIEAAVQVIAENGYHSSQVSKIARQAGVADGTIYLYFKNKEDILVSVFEEKMGDFIEHTSKAIKKQGLAKDQLRTLIEMHFAQLAENKHLAVVTQLELRQSNLELRFQINDVLTPYLQLIDEVIQTGIDEKTFKGNLHIPLARQMIFGTMDEIVTTWVVKEHKYNLVELVDPVHDMLIDGLRG